MAAPPTKVKPPTASQAMSGTAATTATQAPAAKKAAKSGATVAPTLPVPAKMSTATSQVAAPDAKGGRPMIVAINLDKAGAVNAVNKVSSVYAKDDSENFFALNLRENRYLYVNNEKRQSLPEARRLYLPIGGSKPAVTSNRATGVVLIIRSEKDLGNFERGVEIKRSADGQLQGFFDPTTGQSFLVADNPSPDNLVASLAVPMVETQSFKDWFSDSKVVNGQGQPLMVYHGTSKDFTRFQKISSNFEETTSLLGFFCTPDRFPRASGDRPCKPGPAHHGASAPPRERG